MLWLANVNPAFSPVPRAVRRRGAAPRPPPTRGITGALRDFFDTQPALRARRAEPGRHAARAGAGRRPTRSRASSSSSASAGPALLGRCWTRLLSSLDLLKEEEIAVWLRFHPPRRRGLAAAAGRLERRRRPALRPPRARVRALQPRPRLDAARGADRQERLRLARPALASATAAPITRLDQIPDEELDTLARWGFTGLWLIGLWERSRASQRIKQLTRQPRGGGLGLLAATTTTSPPTWAARRPTTTCATAPGARGIRLASDMVPNHMGIDSRWVIEHPDWFVAARPQPLPRPTRFNGPDLSSDGRVGIFLEDHYYDRTDAAVVFKRVDRWTGERALHLPRQRRHQHALERHRAANYLQPRGARGGDPDHPPRRAPVPHHPLRRGHDAGQEALPAPVVPRAGHAAAPSPRAPSTA